MLLQGLYAITDPVLTPTSTLLTQVEATLLGGTRVIQFRDKSQDHELRLQTARQLRTLTQQHSALLIINDDVALCQQCGADGIHLGQGDTKLQKARQQLGSHFIIGATCHGSIELADNALQQGADYLAFGRFFASNTKPNAQPAKLEQVQEFIQQCPVPTVAIGGITLNNAAPLLEAGFDMLAVVQDVFSHPSISKQCQRFQALFSQTP